MLQAHAEHLWAIGETVKMQDILLPATCSSLLTGRPEAPWLLLGTTVRRTLSDWVLGWKMLHHRCRCNGATDVLFLGVTQTTQEQHSDSRGMLGQA